MANSWVIHVRAYAKKHNISYMCAISKAGATYKKPVKKTKKKTKKKTNEKPIKKTKKDGRTDKWVFEYFKNYFKSRTGGGVKTVEFLREYWAHLYKYDKKLKKYMSKTPPLLKVPKNYEPDKDYNKETRKKLYQYKTAILNLINIIKKKDIRDKDGYSYIHNLVYDNENGFLNFIRGGGSLYFNIL